METNVLQQGAGSGSIIIIGIIAMFFMGTMLLLFFYFSKKKIIEKELEKKNLELQYRQELLQATLEVQEEERQRIAQDLHDEISSRLNIVSLNNHLLVNPTIPAHEIAQLRDTISTQLANALESSRRIAHDLLPPVLDKFGLDEGLKELCHECSGKLMIVNYENNVVFDESEKKRHLHVFRILQELINNSVRHGEATNIKIRFDKAAQSIKCTYIDNGKGFDVTDKLNMKGLGMKNIQSRILFLNGNINFNSAKDNGCEIIFTF